MQLTKSKIVTVIAISKAMNTKPYIAMHMQKAVTDYRILTQVLHK